MKASVKASCIVALALGAVMGSQPVNAKPLSRTLLPFVIQTTGESGAVTINRELNMGVEVQEKGSDVWLVVKSSTRDVFPMSVFSRNDLTEGSTVMIDGRGPYQIGSINTCGGWFNWQDCIPQTGSYLIGILEYPGSYPAGYIEVFFYVIYPL